MARDLSLDRTLAVIDTETTGLNPESARLVSLSILYVEPDGRQTLKSRLFNPGVAIPAGASAVHGITDVADMPPFRAFARALAQSLEDCDLAGFGIERFHLPVLLAELRRAGVDLSMENRNVIDVMSIFHRLEPRDFNAAFERYVGDGEPQDRAGGRRSEDVFRILLGEVGSNPEVPGALQQLARWSRGVPESAADDSGRFTYLESGAVAFNFGKYAGHELLRVAEDDPGYVRWVATNDSFSRETRQVAADVLEREDEGSESDPF